MSEKKPNIALAAQWYAVRLRWYVFPIHEPLFNDTGSCIGCTCESYRHSEECKNNHPRLFLPTDQHCSQPGKCPRVRWAEKSTIDADQIARWWRIWPTANIGIDCGKSDLLVFDADLYKESIGSITAVLDEQDEETVTSLTGGGGVHLIYNRQGKLYGNSTRGLPAGIDIRGLGGYIVAAPSLHKSGRRYMYELGYNPADRALLPVPERLDTILGQHTSAHRGNVVSEPDNESVKRSIYMVERWFEETGFTHYGQQEYGRGRRWVFVDCPFQPADNPHANDGGAYICILDDGRIVAGCQHNRCKQQYNTEATGWAWLKQSTGVTVRRPLLVEVVL